MMVTPVDPVDDRISSAGKLVVMAARDQPADHRPGFARRVNCEPSSTEGVPGIAHRAMHRLDDVAAVAEFAEPRLNIGLEDPARGPSGRGDPKPLELPRPSGQEQIAAVRRGPWFGPQIDHPILTGSRAQAPVEAGPPIGLDFSPQRLADLALAARPKLERSPGLGTIAHAVGNIVAVDNEIGAIVGDPAHQNVDVRIVGVPMIDRDPVEPRTQILGYVVHQLAGECLEVGEFAAIFGRDDEAEMVAIVGAASGECVAACLIGLCVEHRCVAAVAGYAVALEIRDMPAKRRRCEARPCVANDPGLDHHPTRHGRTPAGERGDAAAPEPPGPASAPRRSPRAAGAGRCTLDLGGEAQRFDAARTPASPVSGSDPKIVLVGHERAPGEAASASSIDFPG